MTYQSHFQEDRYAQVATQIGQANRKPAEWMWATAKALKEADEARQVEKGKSMSDDHLKQFATKMARAS